MPCWLRGALVGLALLAFAGGGSAEARRRALLIAVEGATHKVVAPLIEQGALPSLAIAKPPQTNE